MQRLTTIFLLFALLSGTYNKCFIYAGYKINKNYIATSLCENRSKPQLNCKGKCFLMKKIKQANDKEKQNEQQFKKNNFEVLYCNNLVILKLPKFYLCKQKCLKSYYKRLNISNFYNDIFRPPQNHLI